MSIDFSTQYREKPKNVFVRPIHWLVVFLLLIITVGASSWFIIKLFSDLSESIQYNPVNTYRAATQNATDEADVMRNSKRLFVPGNFTMDTIKKKGCVADGMLSGYGGNTGEMIDLINRSNCQYLHRALETWLGPPDFEKAEEIMERVKKPGMIYGMFIAEAIDGKADYFDPVKVKNFDFSDMCRDDTENVWGEHTCIPSFENGEYRDYLESVTQRAMDAGIQSFMFGQIYYQDGDGDTKKEISKIVADMRKYAEKKNLQIIIGAQTNSITDEEYLQLFDYIEGGVGISSDGKIESGPCWSGKTSCWALLWHDNFRSKAKNILLNLDWSGIQNDDMSKFALMDQETRLATLENLYSYFTSRQMGFLMPMLAPLYEDNGGCYGPKKTFYSPDNKYKCKDEDGINKILRK